MASIKLIQMAGDRVYNRDVSRNPNATKMVQVKGSPPPSRYKH